MGNKFLIIVVVLLVVGAGIFLIKDSGTNGNVVSGDVGSGEVQEIILGIKNYNYYPNTVTVNVNQPVRIYLDKSVVGCYRSFTIKEFGIAKYLETPNDYVEFTPTKKGSFRFACSMGMGTGTLIVE